MIPYWKGIQLFFILKLLFILVNIFFYIFRIFPIIYQPVKGQTEEAVRNVLPNVEVYLW